MLPKCYPREQYRSHLLGFTFMTYNVSACYKSFLQLPMYPMFVHELSYTKIKQLSSCVVQTPLPKLHAVGDSTVCYTVHTGSNPT